MAAKRGAKMPKPTPDAPRAVEALLRRVRRRTAGAARHWSIEQWHAELTRLRRLSIRRDLDLHAAAPGVFDFPDGSVVVLGPPETVVRVNPPPPAPPPMIGDTIDGPLLAYPDPEHPDGPPIHVPLGGYLLPWRHTPALIISLVGASDEHIRAMARAAVDEALRDRAARRIGSALPRMTAPSAPTRAFADRFAFTKWRDNHINELAELLAWRKRLPKVEQQKYPEHMLGSWAFGQQISAQKTSLAKDVLRGAIECMWEMLPEQLEKPDAPVSQEVGHHFGVTTPDHL